MTESPMKIKALPVNEIICGDCLEVMRTFPDESINCCISSPPYWALRDYGVAGQLGLEPTFEEYIEKLCTVYDEVKRVLRKDGTCWVNLGDTYGANYRGSDTPNEWHKQKRSKGEVVFMGQDAPERSGVPAKSLCLVPHRFAIAMVDRGWILRNVIVWHKPNPMPSSAKDRFTVDFEYVFFFSKSRKYWFEPQYEPYTEPMNRWGGDELKATGESTWDEGTGQTTYRDRNMRPNTLGRNKRTTWTIPTEPCPEAHFATFPKKLVEPMIKAGCPEFVCKKCGKAREKIWDIKYIKDSNRNTNKSGGLSCPAGLGLSSSGHNEQIFKGYTDCGCNAGFEGGIVLDPFCGTATVCVVAAQLKRNYIGIDINEDYVKDFALPKTQAVETGVPVAEQQTGQQGLFE